MPLYPAVEFAIRISKDGQRDKYVRGSRKQLVTFQRMSSALEEVKLLRPSLAVGEFPAVVPIDDVPVKERNR